MKTPSLPSVILRHTGMVTLLISSFFLSCCDELDHDDNNARRDGDYEVRYEVITESTSWFGEYIIETGEKVCHCTPPLLPSGWTYTFTVKEKPFELHIDATVDELTDLPTTSDITTNIYVDDVLVASNTSNWAKGVASADWKIE